MYNYRERDIIKHGIERQIFPIKCQKYRKQKTKYNKFIASRFWKQLFFYNVNPNKEEMDNINKMDLERISIGDMLRIAKTRPSS